MIGLKRGQEGTFGRKIVQDSQDERQLRELAEEAPIVEFVSNVLSQAIDTGASDIHIEPEEFVQHQTRIDGVLISRMEQPKDD